MTFPGPAELVTATPASGTVLATVAPHSIALYRSRPDGSPRNTWAVPVDDLEAVGDRVRVALGGALPLVAEITPAAVADLALAPGEQVWATIKATDIDVYPGLSAGRRATGDQTWVADPERRGTSSRARRRWPCSARWTVSGTRT